MSACLHPHWDPVPGEMAMYYCEACRTLGQRDITTGKIVPGAIRLRQPMALTAAPQGKGRGPDLDELPDQAGGNSRAPYRWKHKP